MTGRGRTMVLAVLAAVLAPGSGASAACETRALPPAEHVARATAIFEGEVLRLRPAPRPAGTLRTAATFKVLKVYKGVREGSEFAVALDSSDCGLHPAVGERVLVFVDTWVNTPVYNKVSAGNYGDPALAGEYERLLAAEASKRK